MSTQDQTPSPPPKFDPGAYPPDSLIHERRVGPDRRAVTGAGGPAGAPAEGERRARKDRRRRIDPTTFEKQYTDDELEFMTAMQRFKVQSGKAFPSFGDVLRVARSLGYRKIELDSPASEPAASPEVLASGFDVPDQA